jgi:hypothetical protein
VIEKVVKWRDAQITVDDLNRGEIYSTSSGPGRVHWHIGGGLVEYRLVRLFPRVASILLSWKTPSPKGRTHGQCNRRATDDGYIVYFV